MKKFAALALLVLLFGCISEANQTASGSNATAPPKNPPANATPPSNATPPPITGNITEAPKPIANETVLDNDSNVTPPQNVTPAAPENPPGLAFGGGRYLLVLDDASVVPSSKEPCGIFSIRLAEDYSLLDKTMICPGESYVWRDESGHAFRIFVVKVAAGYSGTGSWVDVRIYG